jgi:hypothetical protein
MHRVAVESANISALAHDPETSVLEIEFKNGSKYRYFLVPARVYDALRGARSIGAAFNALIRGRYAFKRL